MSDSEIMLKAARLAYPEIEWRKGRKKFLSGRRGRRKFEYPAEVISDHPGNGFFAPENDNDFGKSDQMALQIALEKLGFEFHWNDTTSCFVAEKRMELKDDKLLMAGSKPELLILCVEAL